MFLFIRSQLFFIFRRRTHGVSLRSSVRYCSILPIQNCVVSLRRVGAITLQQKLSAPARCLFFYEKYFV